MRPASFILLLILMSTLLSPCAGAQQEGTYKLDRAELNDQMNRVWVRSRLARPLQELDDAAGLYNQRLWRQAALKLEAVLAEWPARKATLEPYHSMARKMLAECSHQLALETWEQRWLLRDQNEPFAWVVKTLIYDPTHAGARALYPRALAWSQLANKDRDFAAWRARAWCSWLIPAADAFDPAVLAERDQLLWEQHGVPWRVEWSRHMRTARPSAPR
jgi:hypothetical protein